MSIMSVRIMSVRTGSVHIMSVRALTVGALTVRTLPVRAGRVRSAALPGVRHSLRPVLPVRAPAGRRGGAALRADDAPADAVRLRPPGLSARAGSRLLPSPHLLLPHVSRLLPGRPHDPPQRTRACRRCGRPAGGTGSAAPGLVRAAGCACAVFTHEA
ncbi:hypothetical protein ACFP1Z_01245 [Streptomyces gamaensis]|uniref:Uncharacterized protein n=1 Tax=Streptomyces gamaensis TaxID=1763542 RepID=A0ABW0YVI2_9ACTN